MYFIIELEIWDRERESNHDCLEPNTRYYHLHGIHARQLRPYGNAAKSRWPSSSHSHVERGGGWITLAEILKAPVSQKSIMEHLESCASVFLLPHLGRAFSDRCALASHLKVRRRSRPLIYRSVDVRRNPLPSQLGKGKDESSSAINFLLRAISNDFSQFNV